MSEQTEKANVKFKSAYGRILETEALNMTDMLTVSVGIGDKAVKFPVYEALIRKSSTFFDNAMKLEWASARADPRNIDLSDECPDMFKIYLHWLYCKTFPTVSVKNDGMADTEHATLSKCYVMGEKILDVGFKNAVLDAMADAIENQPFYPATYPGMTSIKIIYAGTLEGSLARQFLVDGWVKIAGEDLMKYLNDTLPHAFVLEFSRALVKSKGKNKGKQDTRKWKERMKEYHEAQVDASGQAGYESL